MSDARRSLYLRRINPERNMSRYYAIEVDVDLFSYTLLVRRWGRIGMAGEGQRQVDEHVTEEAAAEALELLARAKIRKGYEAC